MYKIDIPTRSRLFYLEPIGVGSEMCESLLSYIIRLAYHHSVFPVVLIKKEILPIIRRNTSTELNFDHPRFLSQINGSGKSAEKWVQALEELTGRNDLSFLTLLQWKEVFEPKNLFSERYRHCPHCLNENKGASNEKYIPLIWSISIAKYCIHHNVLLRETCTNPNCGKFLPAYTCRMKIGFCPSCGEWLGNRPDQVGYSNNDETKFISQKVGQIIKNNNSTDNISFVSHHKRNFNIFSNNGFFFINRDQSLAEIFSVSHNTISNWRRGYKFNSLEIFLIGCYKASVSPFENTIKRIDNDEQIRTSKNYGLNPNEIKLIEDYESNRSSFISEMVGFIHQTKGVFDIFNKLGCRKELIKRYCRPCFDLLKDLFDKHYQERRRMIVRKLEESLDDIENNSSVKDIAASLNIAPKVLQKMAPELCFKISRKHKLYKKEQAKINVEKKIEQVIKYAESLCSANYVPKMHVFEQKWEHRAFLLNPVIRLALKEFLSSKNQLINNND